MNIYPIIFGGLSLIIIRKYFSFIKKNNESDEKNKNNSHKTDENLEIVPGFNFDEAGYLIDLKIDEEKKLVYLIENGFKKKFGRIIKVAKNQNPSFISKSGYRWIIGVLLEIQTKSFDEYHKHKYWMSRDKYCRLYLPITNNNGVHDRCRMYWYMKDDKQKILWDETFNTNIDTTLNIK